MSDEALPPTPLAFVTSPGAGPYCQFDAVGVDSVKAVASRGTTIRAGRKALSQTNGLFIVHFSNSPPEVRNERLAHANQIAFVG